MLKGVVKNEGLCYSTQKSTLTRKTSDDPDEAIRYLDMGIDTILTNDFLKIKNSTEELRKSTLVSPKKRFSIK